MPIFEQKISQGSSDDGMGCLIIALPEIYC